MLNYMKSEFYRIRHAKVFYLSTAVLCGLVLLFNGGLAFLNIIDPAFRYGTFRFALNMFIGQPMLYMYMAGLIPLLLFLEDKRSGVLQNTIAFGVPREKIILAKGIVCFLTACVIMAITLVFYVGSAFLLLKNPEILPLQEMLWEIGALMPTAIAVLLLVIVLGMIMQKEANVILFWINIVMLVPNAVWILGLKFDVFYQISRWMPIAYFKREIVVYFNSYECIWHTTEGLIRCLISGFIGIVCVLLFGILKVKKQDL